MTFSSATIRIELGIALMLCMLNSGCRLCDYAWQVSVAEPLQHSSYWYEKLARARYCRFARDVLEQEKALARAERDDYQNEPFTPAHEMGFVDGFADYLYAGGTGEPPPLPPRKFWNAKFEGPHGHQATIDWFHGYKHGAMSARGSGMRHYVTIPVSDAVVASTTPYPYGKRPKVTPIIDDADDNQLAAQSRVESAAHSSAYLKRLPRLTEDRQEASAPIRDDADDNQLAGQSRVESVAHLPSYLKRLPPLAANQQEPSARAE